MAAPKLKAPRGTLDVLDARPREALRRRCTEVLGRAGYDPVETPVFEDTELFARGVGATTDIVQKEMFTFEDAGGRSMSLRPEGTAGICRAYVEHGMHKRPQPVKLWYWGPFFRYEAPQAGRFRQFTQVGAEAVGSDDPALDAELIVLLMEVLAGARALRLRISSLGTPATRRAYSDELREFLRAREERLSEEVRARLDANPLRAFDSKDESTRAAMVDAPRLLDRLDPADAEHFAAVRAYLDEAGVEYELDGTLVRGLDYYTRTVFEVESGALGAQSALGGGGRYDGLIEQLGGQPTPGVGWAAGVERILLASGEAPADERGGVFVAVAKEDRARDAFVLIRDIRRRGVRAEMGQPGRSLKGQLKQADRAGAAFTVILGDDVQLKEMDTGEQRELAAVEDVLAQVGAA